MNKLTKIAVEIVEALAWLVGGTVVFLGFLGAAPPMMGYAMICILVIAVVMLVFTD